MSEQTPAWIMNAANEVNDVSYDPGQDEIVKNFAVIIAKHAATMLAEIERLREFIAKVRDRQFYGDSRFTNDAAGSLDHASFEARRILSEQPKESK